MVDSIVRLPCVCRSATTGRREVRYCYGLGIDPTGLLGQFPDYGESLEEAVTREAREETGLELRDLEQFHTYSDPRRDPRFHTITTVFHARAEGAPRAGDDAAATRVVPISEIGGLSFAFDHREVLLEWAKKRGALH
jgi:ADP-ribose pyrophosphatase YjhB (NUDIX family)